MKNLSFILLTLFASLVSFGQSELLFDSNGDLVTIPINSLSNEILGDFAISIDFTMTGDPSKSRTILSSVPSSYKDDGFYLNYTNAHYLTFIIDYSGGPHALVDPTYLLDGTQHTVLISRSGNDVSMYLDGTLLNVYELTNSIKLNNRLLLGNLIERYHLHFHGGISNLQIWNTSRTPLEQENPVTGNEQGLFGYWPMDNIVDQMVPDNSANKNNGVLGIDNTSHYDPTVIITETPDPITNSPEDALIFEEREYKHISVPAIPQYSFGTGDYTMEAWVKVSDPRYDIQMMLSTRQENQGGYYFGLHRINGIFKPAFQVNGSNMSPNISSEVPSIVSGEWAHVAVTHNEGQLDFYVNGLFYGSRITAQPANCTYSELTIGGEMIGAYGFDGQLAHIKLWNRALSTSELANSANHNSPGTNGLVAHFPLNECEGQTINDLSPQANHGYKGNTIGTDSYDPECPTIPCTDPTGISVVQTTESTATLTWATTSPVGKYRLRYSKVTPENWTYVTFDESSNYVLDNLAQGTQYRFQLKSFCDENTPEGSFNNNTTFTTTGATPCVDQDFSSWTTHSNSIDVSWTFDEYKDYYNIRYLKIGTSNWTYITNILPTTGTISNLEPNTEYRIQSKGFCQNNSSDWSQRILTTQSSAKSADINLDTEKELVGIYTLYGKLIEGEPASGQILLYQYSDGSVEKVILH